MLAFRAKLSYVRLLERTRAAGDHIGFWTILSYHLIEALFHLRGLLSFFGRAIWQKWQRV
jgi:hypothetical protein